MAITLDATVGGANANTYIGLSDANSFIEGLFLVMMLRHGMGQATTIKIVHYLRQHKELIEKNSWEPG